MQFTYRGFNYTGCHTSGSLLKLRQQALPLAAQVKGANSPTPLHCRDATQMEPMCLHLHGKLPPQSSQWLSASSPPWE